MSNNSFYSEYELKDLGLKKYGSKVFISKKASLYSPKDIIIGNNVRIDDFCILSGSIILGSYIHISAFSALYGSYGIELYNYSGLSPRTTIFSATDDFSGEYLINSMCSKETRNVIGGKVTLKRFVQIGAGSIILPNLTIGEGTVVGAMSLVKENLKEWGINAGVPAKLIKERKRDLLKYIINAQKQ